MLKQIFKGAAMAFALHILQVFLFFFLAWVDTSGSLPSSILVILNIIVYYYFLSLDGHLVP
ncbi:MAG: hypothetical protein GY754_13900 [bacterium]|nr:hypothetical protein [bacterium]